MDSRISQLEHSLLELGTEMYKMKHQLSLQSEFHEKFVRTLQGLKTILDEQGVINAEDFEAAVELGEAMSLDTQSAFDAGLESDMQWLKKESN